MAANFAPVEGEANTGKVRVGLVLGREHRVKGLGLEDRAVLVGASPEQRCDIASDVPRGRVDATARDGDEVVVADRTGPVGTQCVPRREATADAIGSDQILPLALPVFASDALSSVAYATETILRQYQGMQREHVD